MFHNVDGMPDKRERKVFQKVSQHVREFLCPIIERKHKLRKDSAPERMKIKNYAYELQLEL